MNNMGNLNNSKSIGAMQQTWKSAWTCVPFTFTWWTFVNLRIT